MKLRISDHTFLMILLAFGPSLSVAQWVQTNGPFGEGVYGFASCCGSIYAATNEGVYVSSTGGASWMLPSPGIGTRPIGAITADGSTIYAGIAARRSFGEQGEVLRSTDSGIDWTSISAGLPVVNPRFGTGNSINGIFASGTLLVAGTDKGIYRSTDAGGSWSSSNLGLSETSIQCITANTTGIYAGTSRHGVFCSQDGGTTWFPRNSGISTLPIRWLAADSTGIYAASDSGVYTLPGGTTSWLNMSGGLGGFPVYSIVHSGAILIAGTYGGGIYRSTEGGADWSLASIGLGHPWILSLATAGPALIAGTIGGAYLSTDLGSSWVPASNGFSRCSASALASKGNSLFAGTGAGVFRSRDNGGSWSAENTGLTDPYIWSISTVGNDLYVGTEHGAFRSTNDGEIWARADSGMLDIEWNVTSLGDTVYAATDMSGVFRSTDHGGHWIPVNAGLSDLYTEGGIIGVGGDLLVGTGTGVFRSTDRGLTWSGFSAGLSCPAWPAPEAAVNAITDDGNALFAGTDGCGVFQSVPIGASWLVRNAGFPKPDWIVVERLLQQGGILFAGNLDGLYISTDHGTSWTQQNSGLADVWVRNLAANSINMFVSTGNSVWTRRISDLISSATPLPVALPTVFSLEQNFPNPFNPTTTIRYGLPQRSSVTLSVFNVLGQKLVTLVQGTQNSGYHQVKFDGSGLASGVYLYRLQAGSSVQTRTLLLLR